MFSRKIIISILFSCLFSQYYFPVKYVLANGSSLSRGESNGWPDKGIIDLRHSSDGSVFAGTESGLGKIDGFSNISLSQIEDNLYIITDDNLPKGGNPALKTYSLSNGEDLIIISGIIGIYDSSIEAYHQAGTGISWSLDSGATWKYILQPLSNNEDIYTCVTSDPSPEIADEVSCFDAEWNYEQEDGSIITTTYEHIVNKNEQRLGNVTFDVAADTRDGFNYIYLANWLGMLKRFKYQNTDGNIVDNPILESVPLPMSTYKQNDTHTIEFDQQHLGCDLTCDPTQTINYNSNIGYDPYFGCCTQGNPSLNPQSVCDPTYYYSSLIDLNHNPFSVHIEDDGINNPYIWVGTAGGINRGEIQSETCINWTYYTKANTNTQLGGDWVIGIHSQYIENNTTRIWAITWDSDTPTPHPLSYTDDNGQTWHRDDTPETAYNAITYNLYSLDDSGDGIENKLYASTSKGLLQFEDEEWSKVDISNIFDDIGIDNESDNNFNIYTSIAVNNNILLGTTDGLLAINQMGEIYYPSYVDAVLDGTLSGMLIYPNPYLIDSNHRMATFLVNTPNSGKLEVYDFSMSKVFNTNCESQNEILECSWNGFNNNGYKVSNGVYFCKIESGGITYWEKLGVVKSK